jgi:hypothetical protein
MCNVQLAEREGFEPSRPLRAYGISSAAPSTELGDRSANNSGNNHQSPSSGAHSASICRRVAGLAGEAVTELQTVR